MSDLLSRFKSEVEGRIEWGLCRLPSDVSLSMDECKAIITAQQALRDLETIASHSSDIKISNYFVNSGYVVIFCGERISQESTIPAALRAAVEAMQKGETE